MKNLAGLDSTQAEILRHLAVTERLLARAATRLSGSEQSAEIWAMPDLGLPHSVGRIVGGFYTGALYSWRSTVPMIPVDATVNSCSVSVYRTDREVRTQEEFSALVDRARRLAADTCYRWNYDVGNHFITYAEMTAAGGDIAPGFYLVLHSSACEFKHGPQGLYPDDDAWYAGEVRTLEDPASGRWLRYLEGRVADRFYRRAGSLEEFNRTRQEFFAGAILGTRHCLEAIADLPHYGMPAPDAVAIGCSWPQAGERCLLLTAPGAPLYVLRPQDSPQNRCRLDGRDRCLQPHGLGVRARGDLWLRHQGGGIELNGTAFAPGDSLKRCPELRIRGTASGEMDAVVERFLALCPARVEATLHPRFTYPLPV